MNRNGDDPHEPDNAVALLRFLVEDASRHVPRLSTVSHACDAATGTFVESEGG